MTFFPDDLSGLSQAVTGAVLGYFAVLLAVRLVGLRSLAKMASHDFAVTIAIGSVLASAAMADNTPLAIPLLAILILFGLQHLMSKALSLSPRFAGLTQNTPLLLMRGTEILYDNLRAARVTENELIGKLREANVTDRRQVLAVVFEQTGDISVLHGEPGTELDAALLDDVEKAR